MLFKTMLHGIGGKLSSFMAYIQWFLYSKDNEDQAGVPSFKSRRTQIDFFSFGSAMEDLILLYLYMIRNIEVFGGRLQHEQNQDSCFQEQAPDSSDLFAPVHQSKIVKARRYIPQQQCSCDCSWEHRVSIGATDGNTLELVTVDDESGPVTSVKWAPDSRYISVGLNIENIDRRTSISSWSNGLEQPHFDNDGKILNNDVRVREHIVETYAGHHQEVCGLKWSASDQQLASGGNDNLLHIWDRCMTSANAPTQQRSTLSILFAVNTKVDMRFNVSAAHWLSDREKNRINKDGELVISSTKTKTQKGNIEDALELLQAIIDAASYVPPPPSEEQVKKITKIAAASEHKRLQNKKVLSQKKAFRRSRNGTATVVLAGLIASLKLI
ncbi:peptidyl-tRNA hydrolase ICT1, mitochondrial [Tanacetum coccineum]